jgi:DNA-directed RNA polymerase sigma subunit (sigma70/sigma32)
VGDPLDFHLDEGGWPYPDEVDDDARTIEPADQRSDADDDAVALHALTPHALGGLSAPERAAVVARFGLDGKEPMTMAEVQASLGVSRDQARLALAGGLAKLRTALGDPPG